MPNVEYRIMKGKLLKGGECAIPSLGKGRKGFSQLVLMIGIGLNAGSL
jgi:hypothetical protein